MKIPTPIVQLYLNLNFVERKETQNLVVDSYDSLGFSIIASVALSDFVKNTKGKITYSKSKFELLLPLDFDDNTSNSEFLAKLPEHLQFYVLCRDAEAFAYSGLPQKTDKKSVLFVSPAAILKDYIYGSKNIKAFPCSSENGIIGDKDMLKMIPCDGELEDYREIIADDKYDYNVEEFDFVINESSIKVILNSVGIIKLNKALCRYKHQSISLLIRDSAKKIVAKNYSKSFISSRDLEKTVVAIVNIPTVSLILTKPKRKLFEDVNQFILNFPNLITELKFELSTTKFGTSDVLYVDDKAVESTVKKHDLLENFKKVSFVAKNQSIFQNRSHFVKWVRNKEVALLPYNPVKNYDHSLKASNISITKIDINN